MPTNSHARAPLALLAAILVAAGLAAAAIRASAQGQSLTFTGGVFDATGGVLPQVQVTLEDAGRGATRATTDRSGRFAFAPVAPGRYVLEASVAGFASSRQEIELRRASDWNQAITLQVGNLQETISVVENRSAQQAPRGASATPVRIGGNIRAPHKLVDVRPVYPQAMREAGLEGVVRLDALIDRTGNVAMVRAQSGAAHPDFARSAEAAVKRWQFDPVLLNGEPVEVLMTVSVRFSLND